MRRSSALLLALLFVLVVFSQVTLFTIHESETEQVIIARVIDGDTIELDDGRTVRLVNINAPEKNTQWSAQATAFLKQYENTTVEIEALEADRYGRTLARVYAQSYLNHELVQQGLASKFLVQPSEVKLFSAAELDAINEQKGIWIHSPFYGCFTMSVDEEDELVTIDIACNLSLEGFILKDESRKLYEFKGTQAKRIVLHTAQGADSGENLFWKSQTPIWNSERDSAYLFDPEGKLAAYHSYGY